MTEMASAPSDLAARAVRRLLLIWQDPESRKFSRVAVLHELADGHFAFQYLPGADIQGFSPLVQFPDVSKVYLSTSLPAFFGNRVMSRERESYQAYRHWLGVDAEGEDTPVEILARTGGPRATDTFHVVDDVRRSAGGGAVSRFLASGVRYIDGATERLMSMGDGHELHLRDEPGNPENERAILLDCADNAPVGYVPDWLLPDVHELRESASVLRVFAERVNPDAPPHLRLLCRLEASGLGTRGAQ